MQRLVSLIRLCAALCLWMAAQAQAQDAAPLRSAWMDSQPLFYRDATGTETGFSLELSRMIAQDLGLPLEVFRAENIDSFVRAQQSGESEILSGVTALPTLRDSHVFSDPVAEASARLAVRTEDWKRLATQDTAGLRIGTVSRTLGSDPALFPDSTLINYPTLPTALVALLSHQIDAVSAPGALTFGMVRAAGLDDRVIVLDTPLVSRPRVIALHQSRAALLPAINAAVARLEADGRLADLRAQFLLEGYAPPPDVLRVGFTPYPPYQIRNPDGSFSGFSVDVLRDLAELAGLTFEIVPISLEQWGQGPAPGTYDMLPILTVSDERKARNDFALPIEQIAFSLFQRSGGTAAALEDLTGQRVGVLKVSVVRGYAASHIPEAEIVPMDDLPALLDALLSGDIDAALASTSSMQDLIAERGIRGRVSMLTPPVWVSRAAPALRLGLGPIRAQLDGVIPGYLVSTDYTDLVDSYFGPKIFWTRERRLAAGLAGGVVILLLAGLVLVLMVRARTQAAIAEERRHQSRRLRAVIDTANSGILALDRDGAIVLFNPQAAAMFRLSEHGPRANWQEGLQFCNVETTLPVPRHENPVTRASLGPRLVDQVYILKASDAPHDEASRFVRINSAPLGGADPEIQTVLMVDDITEEMLSKQSVDRSNRLDALGQLTGGIAHDFNNILVSLVFALDLAAAEQDLTRRRGFFDSARRSIDRGRALIDRLMGFASRRAGVPRTHRMSEVLSEFEPLVRPIIQSHARIHFDYPEDDLWVRCDLAPLETALMNLVLNSRDAIRASGKGSEIAVTVRAFSDQTHPDMVEILVEDDGPGMDADTLERAIDPFFTTKSDASGTGLGLSMVYGFASQSQGVFSIRSEPGSYTSVRLLLPRAEPAVEMSDADQSSPALRGKGELILLAEDNIEVRDNIGAALVRSGYRVVAAETGDAAKALADHGVRPDLLLSDVHMQGGLTGPALAEALRADRPDLPVILMTGYRTAEDTAGIQDMVLTKPFGLVQLLQEIRKRLPNR